MLDKSSLAGSVQKRGVILPQPRFLQLLGSIEVRLFVETTNQDYGHFSGSKRASILR